MVSRVALVTIAAALAALAAWVWVGPEQAPLPAAGVTVSPETWCREWGKAMLAMADRVDAAARKHFKAHEDWKAGKITEEQKFAIWNQTIHSGKIHSGHFRELERAWKVACLGAEPARPAT